MKNGTPQAYDIEYMDRIADIKSGNTVIKDIESVPDFFAPLSIQEDSNFWIRIPTCTQHLILAFKSKKCRKYAFYAGRESIISILKIPNPYNTAQKSH